MSSTNTLSGISCQIFVVQQNQNGMFEVEYEPEICSLPLHVNKNSKFLVNLICKNNMANGN